MFMLPINPQTYLVHISVVVDLFACRFLTSSRSFQQESRPVDNIRDLDISRVGSCSPHSGLVPMVNVINKLIKISRHYGSINRLVQFKVFWLEWVRPIISAPMWEFHITRSLLPPEGSPGRSDHCGSNQTLGGTNQLSCETFLLACKCRSVRFFFIFVDRLGGALKQAAEQRIRKPGGPTHIDITILYRVAGVDE